MSYKLQHAAWKPGYHALSIWECIGELSEERRGKGLMPPRPPATAVYHWYDDAVRQANAAIDKMMQEVEP